MNFTGHIPEMGRCNPMCRVLGLSTNYDRNYQQKHISMYHVMSCEQSRKPELHGKDIHKFAKVTSLTSVVLPWFFFAVAHVPPGQRTVWLPICFRLHPRWVPGNWFGNLQPKRNPSCPLKLMWWFPESWGYPKKQSILISLICLMGFSTINTINFWVHGHGNPWQNDNQFATWKSKIYHHFF